MVKLRNIIRIIFIEIRYLYFTKLFGMNFKRNVRISLKAHLDKTNPKGIHIGNGSYVAAGAFILTHDFSRDIHKNTYIGENCFIGINSIILPGIKIGNSVIVGSGSVVTKDIPSNCIVAGNPAKIIKEGISTTKYGQII